MSDHRWQLDKGPGQRWLPLKTRAKRWLVEFATRDARVRRIALNRIFANHAADGVLCLVPFSDHTVFVDPRDDRIAYTVLSGRCWQRAHLLRALDAVDRAGRWRRDGVFVDVGANFGLVTLYAMLSGRFARAIAIEPDAWNRMILQKNLAANGLEDRVTVVSKAASDRAGEMALHRDAKNLGAHSLEPGFSMSPVENVQTVPVQPVDAILAEVGVEREAVGFVKIDVEGHEFAVLAGMAGLLKVRPPIMIEVTFDVRDGGSADSERLRRSLPGYGSVVDLDRSAAQSPVSLAAFRATGDQHELVVY